MRKVPHNVGVRYDPDVHRSSTLHAASIIQQVCQQRAHPLVCVSVSPVVRSFCSFCFMRILYVCLCRSQHLSDSLLHEVQASPYCVSCLPSVSTSICTSPCLSVRPSVCLTDCVAVLLSFWLPACLPVHLSVRPSACLSALNPPPLSPPAPSAANVQTPCQGLVCQRGSDCACVLVAQVWVDDDEQAESLAMVVRTGLTSLTCAPLVL